MGDKESKPDKKEDEKKEPKFPNAKIGMGATTVMIN